MFTFPEREQMNSPFCLFCASSTYRICIRACRSGAHRLRRGSAVLLLAAQVQFLSSAALCRRVRISVSALLRRQATCADYTSLAVAGA